MRFGRYQQRYTEEKTEQVWAYWIDYCIANGGVPPTVRKIQEDMGFNSTSGVHHHIRKLVKQGRLEQVEPTRYAVVGSLWQPPEGS